MAKTIQSEENKNITDTENTTLERSDECKKAATNLYEAIMDGPCGSVGCGGDDIGLLNNLMSLCQL